MPRCDIAGSPITGERKCEGKGGAGEGEGKREGSFEMSRVAAPGSRAGSKYYRKKMCSILLDAKHEDISGAGPGFICYTGPGLTRYLEGGHKCPHVKFGAFFELEELATNQLI